METFWRTVSATAASGEPALLITVMEVERQVPVVTPAGSHLLLTASGTKGSLGSPALDRLVGELLRPRLAEMAFVTEVDAPPEIADEDGLLQGGVVHLLAQPLTDFDSEQIEALAAAVDAYEPAAVITPLPGDAGGATSRRPAVAAGGMLLGEAALPTEAIDSLFAGGLSKTWAGEGESTFVDILRPQERLIIFGATVVGEALCTLAAAAGFRVTVVDDTGFAQPERYPHAEAIIRQDDPVAALLSLPELPAPWVVCMSVGHRLDHPAVEGMLRRPLRYLGMIGSRGRVTHVRESLGEAGFTPEEQARLTAPLGLNIGGNTPFEIAVSAMAQIIQVRNGRLEAGTAWIAPATEGQGQPR